MTPEYEATMRFLHHELFAEIDQLRTKVPILELGEKRLEEQLQARDEEIARLKCGGADLVERLQARDEELKVLKASPHYFDLNLQSRLRESSPTKNWILAELDRLLADCQKRLQELEAERNEQETEYIALNDAYKKSRLHQCNLKAQLDRVEALLKTIGNRVNAEIADYFREKEQ